MVDVPLVKPNSYICDWDDCPKYATYRVLAGEGRKVYYYVCDDHTKGIHQSRLTHLH